MKRCLPGLLLALVVLAAYADPLLTGRTFAGRDLVPYFLPVENAVHDAYARGQWPVWMSEISGGRPLAANPNVGALYPVRPLLSLVAFPTAARLFPIAHWVLAGLGAMLLLRAVAPSTSGASAFICGASYVFSGVGVTEVFYPNIQPGMALLPWIAWAAVRPGAATGRGVVLLSALLGLDLLAGDVFTVALAVVAVVLWFAVAAPRAEHASAAGRLVLALALAALIALPQILAAALWAPETRRAISGLTIGEALTFCVRPLRLLELVVPFPFGATWEIDPSRVWGERVFGGSAAGFFSSLYAGALGMIGAVSLWRSREPSARFARALLLAGLVLSVSLSLVPASLAGRAAPLALRYPEKFAVAIALSLSVFAGLSLDAWRNRDRSPRWTLGVAVVLAAFAVFAAVLPAVAGRTAVGLAGENPSYAATAGRELPGSLAEGGLLWVATLVGLELTRGRGARRIVAAGLVSLVPLVACRRIARAFREEAVFAPTAFARMMVMRDPASSFRVLGASIFRPESSQVGFLDLRSDVAALEHPRRSFDEYTQALWARGTVFNRDFDRADLSRLDSLRRLVVETGRVSDPASLLASLCLRFSIRYRDEPPPPGFRRIGGDRVQDWDENAAALPDVRLASAWREARSAPEALSLLTRSTAAGTIVVESGEEKGGEGEGGSARVLERSPERLVVETDSKGKAWLFVLRGYWPYRDVSVDGHPTDVSPAQLAFSALPVPAGRHRVEWEEKLPGWQVSRSGPALFALAGAFLLVRRRRPDGGTPRPALKASP